jgi:hypothetical protein
MFLIILEYVTNIIEHTIQGHDYNAKDELTLEGDLVLRLCIARIWEVSNSLQHIVHKGMT